MMKTGPPPLSLQVERRNSTSPQPRLGSHGSQRRVSVFVNVWPIVVAGPLCESGDVFTRDAREFLEPRELPKLDRGDLLVFHDAGAYGVQMSSYYNSLGRAPQVWAEGNEFHLISRRESLRDIVANECFEPISA